MTPRGEGHPARRVRKLARGRVPRLGIPHVKMTDGSSGGTTVTVTVRLSRDASGTSTPAAETGSSNRGVSDPGRSLVSGHPWDRDDQLSQEAAEARADLRSALLLRRDRPSGLPAQAALVAEEELSGVRRAVGREGDPVHGD